MVFPARKNVIDAFSTFIELRGDRFNKWSANSSLRRSMQNCCDSFPQILQQDFSQQERYWSIYWYKNWQSPQSDYVSLAKMHLQAYLQEPLYIFSLKNAGRGITSNNRYDVADFFQMANAEVETVLENFDFRRSSGLKEYFSMAIRTRIRDILRQRNEADVCTEWALLRKISKKVLQKALENQGFGATQIAQYSLAWKCFNKLYVAKQARGTRQLPKPTPQLWQEIANLYNNCVSMLDKDVPPSTAEEIETWLQKAAANVRNYKFPSVGSLDAFNSQDDSNQTSENLLISSDNSPMADMIAEEEFHARQDEISRLNEVLSTALKALDNQSQQIFRLYYREELTQQQIMQQLQTNQSMISRKLRKGKEFLLEKLLEWGKSLHIFVNPNQIKDMSNALEEWLQNHLGDSNMTL